MKISGFSEISLLILNVLFVVNSLALNVNDGALLFKDIFSRCGEDVVPDMHTRMVTPVRRTMLMNIPVASISLSNRFSRFWWHGSNVRASVSTI